LPYENLKSVSVILAVIFLVLFGYLIVEAVMHPKYGGTYFNSEIVENQAVLREQELMSRQNSACFMYSDLDYEDDGIMYSFTNGRCGLVSIERFRVWRLYGMEIESQPVTGSNGTAYMIQDFILSENVKIDDDGVVSYGVGYNVFEEYGYSKIYIIEVVFKNMGSDEELIHLETVLVLSPEAYAEKWAIQLLPLQV
jgi:hypothetical protein